MKKVPFISEWILGILLLLAGMEYTFSSTGVSGLFYLLGAAMFLPPLYSFAGKYLSVFKRKNFRVVFFILFLILAVITSPHHNKQIKRIKHTPTKTPSITGTKTLSPILSATPSAVVSSAVNKITK